MRGGDSGEMWSKLRFFEERCGESTRLSTTTTTTTLALIHWVCIYLFIYYSFIGFVFIYFGLLSFPPLNLFFLLTHSFNSGLYSVTVGVYNTTKTTTFG